MLEIFYGLWLEWYVCKMKKYNYIWYCVVVFDWCFNCSFYYGFVCIVFRCVFSYILYKVRKEYFIEKFVKSWLKFVIYKCKVMEFIDFRDGFLCRNGN